VYQGFHKNSMQLFSTSQIIIIIVSQQQISILERFLTMKTGVMMQKN